MSEINLSSAVRTSLSSLQATADLLSSTQERLATGNRVNSALDDPSSFFTAAALTDRASDLSTLLDDQGQAIQVVEAADQGISAISDLVDSARAIANQALGTDSSEERASFASQFDDILDQIETLAGDASFNGVNLLDSLNSADLTVVFNEENTASLTVEGVNFREAEAGLGLNRVSSANNTQGEGAAVASQTQTAATNFNTTDTFEFEVGNSNGTSTSFSVDFEDSDAAEATPAQASLSAADFNTTDAFNIVGVDGTAAINFETNDTVSGSVTAADGTGAGQINISNLAAGDTIDLDDGAGGTFTFTVGASVPADDVALAAEINQAAVAAGVSTITAEGDATGTESLTFTSTVGDVSFTFDDASAPVVPGDIVATTTNGTGGAPGSGTISNGDGTGGTLDTSDITVDDVFNIATTGSVSGNTDISLTQTQVDAINNAADADGRATALASALNTQLDAAIAGGATVADVNFTASSDDVNAVTAVNNDNFTITFGDDSATNTTGASTNFVANENETDGLSAQDIADQINAESANTGITASLDPANTDSVILTSEPNATTTEPGNFTVVQDPTNVNGNQETIIDTSIDPATSGDTTVAFEAAVDNGLSVSEISDQINAAAAVAGINTDNGSFTVGSSLTSGIPPVTNITFSSDTGNVSISSNGSTPLSVDSADETVTTNSAFTAGNGGGSDFADVDSINQALQAIDTALGTLRSTATALGSDLSTIQIRSDFTENLINTLEVGAGNLTLADLNEEGANLLTLQTRQQLASTSLSFATQADQSVLSLF